MELSDAGTRVRPMDYYAGVDLGASNIRAAVADADAKVIGAATCATPRGPTGIVVTETVLSAVREACDDAGIEPRSIEVAGIGSIGPLDLAAGVIENPANLPDTIDRIPLTGPLESLIGGDRVILRNDADTGLVGERFYGEHSPDDMIYLTISSGVGAGIAVDGKLLSGWDGNAGEIGHMVLDPDGTMTCGCGRDGHWEAYCSGNNIPKYAQQLHDQNPVETDLPISDSSFDAADVFANAGTDDFADHVIERVAEWNAIGIANLAHAYAPIVINVGGAVALNNPDLVIDPINEQLSDLVLTNVPDVQLTTLSGDVVVHGALASALRADGHTRPEDPSQFRK
jgi:glucokinase